MLKVTALFVLGAYCKVTSIMQAVRLFVQGNSCVHFLEED